MKNVPTFEEFRETKTTSNSEINEAKAILPKIQRIAKDLNNFEDFKKEDPGLNTIATMNGKSLMFRIGDIEDKLKETINESIKVIDDYKYQVSKKEPKIGDWVLKFKQVNSWEFKSGTLKEKDYQYFPVKVVLKSFLEPEDLLIVATNNPKLTNDGVKIVK